LKGKALHHRATIGFAFGDRLGRLRSVNQPLARLAHLPSILIIISRAD
jgi:hypothetical protein